MSDDVKVPEKPEECEACQFETTELESYRSREVDPRGPVHHWFCALCAGTMSSNAVQYPALYPNKDVLHTICYVGNAILQALRRPPILFDPGFLSAEEAEKLAEEFKLVKRGPITPLYPQMEVKFAFTPADFKTAKDTRPPRRRWAGVVISRFTTGPNNEQHGVIESTDGSCFIFSNWNTYRNGTRAGFGDAVTFEVDAPHVATAISDADRPLSEGVDWGRYHREGAKKIADAVDEWIEKRVIEEVKKP